jgi:hypothetical protein
VKGGIEKTWISGKVHFEVVMIERRNGT